MYITIINESHSPKESQSKEEIQGDISDGKSVDFGGKGYSDYTIHGDPQRMKRYLARHGRMGEEWSKKGLYTAGFWSRWLLWSKPSMSQAKQLMSKRFGLTFS